ncbi:hypothetical protein [Paraburkholderia caballeronis]|uniref:Uncharacterized protein n=1 Tax=Paraburkholderia caballeronis TaxID=416943 RepID=A0A1H7FEJ8_9BURK|nr:hypothetical protein [Paraburkholderia caballeronis]PXW25036.1 hypothetical protein C7403_106357 [Paraburkholderia caballeronis]PXW93220.1 hypothetical protein C7407_12911 [Paraburkholderia caballeronis]RAJ86671.1 hypothetical protein C7409_12911 [Paraburkholderia caballeronis]TDV04362.1 hypothetical protein C7408_13417 [Paraburkholderia caballeronis]TDV17720.1 hypothetical protein C7404_13617 [Paraburkholderia caballeronis]
MAFEHRGFRVAVDVVPDEADVQWQCRAEIHGVEGRTVGVELPGVELAIPKLKIDVLMALSMVEHRAVTSIDEWHAEHLEAV